MKRHATARWEGDLQNGNGRLTTQSVALDDTRYHFKGRFEDETPAVTNPEELLAAAHAGCFAMQLSHFLAENGTPASMLSAKASVDMTPQTGITASHIELEGDVPEIDEEKFQELAQKAKTECPVSNALSALDISMTATLLT